MNALHSPATGVKEIFSLYGKQYQREHKLPEHLRKTMFALQNCQTAALGGRVDQCDNCGYKRIFYNSCRNRHCPLCQGLKSIQWIDKLSANLLPVRYFHIVFTIPSELNRLTLVNQDCLYNILFKSASESLLMLAKDPKHLGVRTGMVAVLHTWGQNLTEHPHLHTLVPAGGWSEIAQCWKHSPKKFLMSVNVISRVFRGKFLELLKAAYNNKELKFDGEIKQLQQKRNFQQLLNLLYHKPWVVFAKKPFKNPSHIVKYLARYTHRVAIGNNRIVDISENQVTFKWKDYKCNGAHKLMKLSANEFIRRFLLHILPKGFSKIRYFGIYAARCRNSLLLKCRTALGYQLAKQRFEGLSWQNIISLTLGIDICKCPLCKNGNMKPHLIMQAYRAPPIINYAFVL